MSTPLTASQVVDLQLNYEHLREKVGILGDQNEALWELNGKLHMENARLLKLIEEHQTKMLPLIESLRK